eukprot:scaffold296291_cov31-Tisochrysis_lutea.AAC.2
MSNPAICGGIASHGKGEVYLVPRLDVFAPGRRSVALGSRPHLSILDIGAALPRDEATRR